MTFTLEELKKAQKAANERLRKERGDTNEFYREFNESIPADAGVLCGQLRVENERLKKEAEMSKVEQIHNDQEFTELVQSVKGKITARPLLDLTPAEELAATQRRSQPPARQVYENNDEPDFLADSRPHCSTNDGGCESCQ